MQGQSIYSYFRLRKREPGFALCSHRGRGGLKLCVRSTPLREPNYLSWQFPRLTSEMASLNELTGKAARMLSWHQQDVPGKVYSQGRKQELLNRDATAEAGSNTPLINCIKRSSRGVWVQSIKSRRNIYIRQYHSREPESLKNLKLAVIILNSKLNHYPQPRRLRRPRG